MRLCSIGFHHNLKLKHATSQFKIVHSPNEEDWLFRKSTDDADYAADVEKSEQKFQAWLELV